LFPNKKVRVVANYSKLVFFTHHVLMYSFLLTTQSFQINKVTEMSLSANQERAQMEKRKLDWKVEGSTEEPKVVRGGPVDPTKLVVELAPMEIRTFFIEFDPLQTVPVPENHVAM